MKRFIICTTLAGSRVGSFYSAAADKLAARGHKVILISDGLVLHLEKPDGNPSIRVWPSKRPIHLADFIFLNRLISEFKPDCIISNFGSVPVCILTGWMRGVKNNLVWHHTASKAILMDNKISSFKNHLLKLRLKLLYRAATGFLCATQYIAKDLSEAFSISSKKIRVLPFLIPDPLLSFPPVTPSRWKISFTGRFHPSKGQETMIRALPVIHKKFPDVFVDFLGSGPAEAACKKLADSLGVKDKCLFSGYIGKEAVLFEKISSANLHVSASFYEGFGLAPIEAIACGTPVVAADIPAYREVLTEGKNVYFFKPGDFQGLAAQIIRIFEDGGLRNDLSINARNEFLNRFCAEKNAEKYAEIFEGFAG